MFKCRNCKQYFEHPEADGDDFRCPYCNSEDWDAAYLVEDGEEVEQCEQMNTNQAELHSDMKSVME